MTAAAFLVLAAATSAEAQTLLGVAAANDELAVPLDRIVSPFLLRVEIDGEEISGPFAIRDGDLIVRIPPGLVGVRHDLVVFVETAAGFEELDRWVFDTAGGDAQLAGTVQFEVGYRGSESRSEAYAVGGGRIDLDVDGGRFRAGLQFTRPENAGRSGNDEFAVDDYFVEARTAAAGDDLFFRFGDHFLESDTRMLEAVARRGISARLVDVAGAYEVTVFALRATPVEGLDNFTGLQEPSDRIFGATGFALTGGGSGPKLAFAGYSGETTALPTDNPGVSEGAGISLSSPIADGRAYVVLGYDWSRWYETGSGTAEGDGGALTAEISFDVLPSGRDDALSFGVEYRHIEDGFFSVLNTDLIRGEEGVEVSAEYYSAFWQLDARVGIARTNVAGDPAAPTDRLRSLSFDAIYDPNDFTGGFLNGMHFYFSGLAEAVDRTRTPAGALPPQDNTFYLLNFGVDKFQPGYSWAAGYSYELIDDRTPADEDTSAHWLEAFLSYTPDAYTTLSAQARVGNRLTPSGSLALVDVGVSLRHEFVPDRWSFGLGASLVESEDASEPDGAFVGGELAWEFAENQHLVVSAEYGRGSEASHLVDGEGWVFGLALRSELDLFSGSIGAATRKALFDR